MNRNKLKKALGGGLAAVALFGGGAFALNGTGTSAYAEDGVATNEATTVSQAAQTAPTPVTAPAATNEFGGLAPTLKASTKEQFFADDERQNAGENIERVFNTRDQKLAEEMVDKDRFPDGDYHGMTVTYTSEQAWYGVRVFYTFSGVNNTPIMTISEDPSMDTSWEHYASENPQEAAWIAERYPDIPANY